MKLKNTSKSDDEIAISILKKCGYSIDFDEVELDEEDNEVENSDEGYFWQDDCGGRSELFETEAAAVEDCLMNLREDDYKDVKLFKYELEYLEKLLN